MKGLFVSESWQGLRKAVFRCLFWSVASYHFFVATALCYLKQEQLPTDNEPSLRHCPPFFLVSPRTITVYKRQSCSCLCSSCCCSCCCCYIFLILTTCFNKLCVRYKIYMRSFCACLLTLIFCYHAIYFYCYRTRVECSCFAKKFLLNSVEYSAKQARTEPN